MGLFFTGLTVLGLVMFQWWRDIRLESSALGLHTSDVEEGLRWGVLLFIASEVILFLRFFWAFFHMSLAPAVELGGSWPPFGVNPFDPFQVPLLNTIVLLSSGVRVTWAHHATIMKNHSRAAAGLLTTVLLGVYFTSLQALEYYEASFSIADSVYGSTFFVATGFHGIHVLVGTAFLTVCIVRLMKGELRDGHHFGFEAAAWYWHFVDVVWLFLFVAVYW
jgi:cytochrome c oxidase subunit 3